MTDRVQRAKENIQRIQREAREELESIDSQMADLRRRALELGQRGTVGPDEAMEQFRGAMKQIVDQGNRKIEHHLVAFTRSRLTEYRDSIPGLVSWKPAPTLGALFRDADDLGPIVAALFAEQLENRMQAIIDERCTSETVPAPDERAAEFDNLIEELKSLEIERDQVQDALAKTFSGFTPSEATQRAERQQRSQEIIDGLNEAVDERQGTPWLEQQREKAAASP